MAATHSVRIKHGLGRHLAAASALDRYILQEFLGALETCGPHLKHWPDFERMPRMAKQPRGETLYRCSLRQSEPNVTAVWRVFNEDIEVDVLHWGALTAIDEHGDIVHPGR